jgi:hypothetical protein
MNSRVHRPRYPYFPNAVVRAARLVPTHGSAVEKRSSHAPFDVVRRESRHRPMLQASVLLRQWSCTLASLLIVVPIEMFAGACRAIRCTEASVRRSVSR